MTTRSYRRIVEITVLGVVWAALPVLAAAGGPGADRPADVSSDWWLEVRRSIELEAYGIVADGTDGSGRRASNPAHGFEVWFDEGGVRLAPEDDSSWEWGLSLVGWGRPAGLVAAQRGELLSEQDRVELERGSLTEWFVNTPQGLEHGFTVLVRPQGEGERLVFDLSLSGGLRPVFAEDGQAIDFYSAGNVAVLRYGKLLVTDAVGARVSARLEPIGGGVRIAVDDAQAVYPLTVDPLATSASWSALGQGTNNYFGFAVAPAGDVDGDGYSDVVVGAYGNASNTGKAYVYRGGASGLSATAWWTKVGEASGSQFGYAVSTAGDVNGDGYSDVVIGAPGHNGSTGKTYVYLGGASGLAPTASWSAVGQGTNNQFGASVAPAGDVNGDGYSDIIVGASGYSSSRGRSYVFLGGASGLSTSAAWTATGEAAGDAFAHAVSTVGDLNGDGYSDIAVGAYGNASNRGKAYVYLGSASGLGATSSWTQVGAAAGDSFGRSVSTAGDVDGDGYADLVIGADGSSVSTGKAYLYRGSASGLSATASWTAFGETASDHFGSSVATVGDVNGDGYSDVVVGAFGSTTNTGKVYVYLGQPSGLTSTAAWSHAGEASGDRYGSWVLTAGDANGDGYSDVLIGAYGKATNTGKTYLYLGGPNGLSATAWWTKTGGASNDTLGYSLASAGDVDGDGHSDVIVGATGAGTSDSGMVYVFRGGTFGLSASPWWSATLDTSGFLGWSVQTAGDVNGDGYSDVIVGAPYFTQGAGKANLYLGGPTGMSASPVWTALGENPGDKFGYSVSTAGDVNADGYADVLVGAYFYSPIDDGKVYLYLGGPDGLSATPAWTAVGEDSYLGNSVSTAGDVNGDGYDDVVIGGYAYSAGLGRVRVYHGGPSGLPATPSWTKTGTVAGGGFGYSVSTAGDVDGDGYSDIVVGAYNENASTGKAYVFLGGPAGLANTASWSKSGENGRDLFGHHVSTAGDVNGDGFSDVMVGAQSYPRGTDQGKAYLFLGSATGLSTSEEWSAVGQGSGVFFGHAVSTAGDVDGDGFADVVVSASRYSAGAGRVYLYRGGERGGLSFLPRQLRSDQSAPISLGGAASNRRFSAGLTLKSPVGRVGRWLQWQVAPLGTGLSPAIHPIESDTVRTEASDARRVQVDLAEDHQGYVWRARVRYDPVDSPFVPWSRWFTIPGNGVYETDLITTEYVPCDTPTEELFISTVELDGSGRPVLTFQDSNPPTTVTGYNAYRSSSPAGPWSRIATNVSDADSGKPGIQFVDPTGGGAASWYYQVAALNGTCGAEGPW